MTTEVKGRAGVATAALIAVTALWGTTFVVVKTAIETVPPIEFLALRFIIATALLVLVGFRHLKNIGAALLPGLAAGGMVGVGYLFQTLGLKYTSATRSGFITGLFVVMAPFADAMIAKRLPRMRGWIAIGLASAGLFALTGMDLAGLNVGDFMTLITAAAFALHIAILGKYSPLHRPVALATLQMAVASALFIPLSLATETPVIPTTASIWIALLVLGIGASAVAFLVMTWAQRHLSPTRTAVTLTMEPVFAGLTGYLILSERLSTMGIIGAAAIFLSMLIVSLDPSQGE